VTKKPARTSKNFFGNYRSWIIIAAGFALVAYINTTPSPAPAPALAPTSTPPESIVRPLDPIGDLISSLPEIEINEVAEDIPNWRKHAAAAQLAITKSAIAIVIDDLGLNKRKLEALYEINQPLTLSFLSYADGLPELTGQARAKGYELLVHIPMEPEDMNIDSGNNVLTTDMDEETLMQTLNWHLSRFKGYVGFNNHMGSKFTADRDGMQLVIDAASDRGLLFFDSRTTDRTLGKELADEAGIPVIERDVFLDNDIEEAAILIQLKKAEAIARKSGMAVVIGHPHSQTVAALKTWLATLNDIQIVPLSALVKRLEGESQVARNYPIAHETALTQKPRLLELP